MAAGDVFTTHNTLREVCLFTGISAANGQPSASTDGIPCYPTNKINSDDGACPTNFGARDSTLILKGTAAGGSLSCTGRLWVYHTQAAVWVPMGTGADATKGIINNGSAIGPTKTLAILHAEPVLYVGHFDRIYLELFSITGTTPSFQAWINTIRSGA